MRTSLLAIIAAGIGIAIALIDARPTWDDTGITAGALLVAAFIVSAIAGRRPWLLPDGGGTPNAGRPEPA